MVLDLSPDARSEASSALPLLGADAVAAMAAETHTHHLDGERSRISQTLGFSQIR